jgi:hypothetical protein
MTEGELVSTSSSGPKNYPVTTRTTRRHLFAEVQFLSYSVPVLLRIEETVTTCKKGCTPNIVLTLTGPLASYENATPHESLESLLGGKQQIIWTYTPGATAQAERKLTAEFKVLSLQFERDVLRLINNRFPRIVSKKEDQTLDQNFILVGVGRALREINEEVLR